VAKITFQVIDGVDKGRVFREMGTPVTIGREEGNTVRLNDERVSRFHAKVQQDQTDVVLTDLESTNGTRVNGNLVQIHRLRFGDCVNVGRSVLLFGSNEEIATRMADIQSATRHSLNVGSGHGDGHPSQTLVQATALDLAYNDVDLEFAVNDEVKMTDHGLFIGSKEFPPLPLQMSPSQSARLAEIFDFLHRAMSQSVDRIKSNDDGTQVTLDYGTWQKVLAIGMLLAKYHRAITEPESWEE
jgi:pSer/pThr/pTyr-binding forkhead associated (FHA) protein